MVHEIPPSVCKLTLSHVYALNEGAVITQPLNISQQEFQSLKYNPGDVIEITTEEEPAHTLSCRILDIESIRVESESTVKIRVTLEKAD